MIDLLHSAQTVQQFCDAQGWSFAFIGGLAVNRWGRARTTNDADLCLITGFGSEEDYIDRFLSAFSQRRADTREFALVSRVLLLESDKGHGIDVSLGALEFEERSVSRASLYAYSTDVTLRTVSAEDLVVLKAFAGREIDWFDIKGILARQHASLDMNLVLQELEPLCDLKESPETIKQLETVWHSVQQA